MAFLGGIIQTTMPNVKKFIPILLGFFALAYLIGAFASASFDISKWDAFLRGAVAIIGGFISTGVAFAFSAEDPK